MSTGVVAVIFFCNADGSLVTGFFFIHLGPPPEDLLAKEPVGNLSYGKNENVEFLFLIF